MEFCATGVIYLLFTSLLDLVKKWQAVSHTHAMDKMAVVAVWMMNAMIAIIAVFLPVLFYVVRATLDFL